MILLPFLFLTTANAVASRSLLTIHPDSQRRLLDQFPHYSAQSIMTSYTHIDQKQDAPATATTIRINQWFKMRPHTSIN